MKVTTKKGDGGETDIFNKRIKKTDNIIKLIGKLDTIIAIAGVVKNNSSLYSELDNIQELIKKCLNNLSYGKDLDKEIIDVLEKELEKWEEKVENIKGFIKPKGSSSLIHFLRAYIREAEIFAWESKYNNLAVFLNRLSDYVFLLAIYEASSNKELEYFKS